MDVIVRHATEADLGAITAIYNHYVVESPATFDIEPVTDRKAWFGQYSERGRHRLLVADENGIVGWTASSPLRPKPAYQRSVETTLYVAPEAVGRGLGRMLYGALFEALEGESVHRAYAVLVEGNEASVQLHREFGFERVGTFDEAGWKFDRYWTVELWEKRL